MQFKSRLRATLTPICLLLLLLVLSSCGTVEVTAPSSGKIWKHSIPVEAPVLVKKQGSHDDFLKAEKKPLDGLPRGPEIIEIKKDGHDHVIWSGYLSGATIKKYPKDKYQKNTPKSVSWKVPDINGRQCYIEATWGSYWLDSDEDYYCEVHIVEDLYHYDMYEWRVARTYTESGTIEKPFDPKITVNEGERRGKPSRTHKLLFIHDDQEYECPVTLDLFKECRIDIECRFKIDKIMKTVEIITDWQDDRPDDQP